MKEKEQIKVYVKVVKGQTVCICCKSAKGCADSCELDIVERDRFRGWESTMKRDRFGRNESD